MNKLKWHIILKRIKQLYILACFTGAMIFYVIPGGIRVLAEVRDYALVSRVDVQQSKMDAISDRQGAIERHLENTDKLVQSDSNRISAIQGVGTGVLGFLGVLQALGLVAQRKSTKG